MPDTRLPPFPEDLRPVWEDFAALRPTRLIGLATQQITWAEINAYAEAVPGGLPYWQKRLIRRLDDAYEAAVPGRPSSKPKQTNVADIRASLRAAIKARQAKARAAEPPKESTS